jgi:hypothetical protein
LCCTEKTPAKDTKCCYAPAQEKPLEIIGKMDLALQNKAKDDSYCKESCESHAKIAVSVGFGQMGRNGARAGILDWQSAPSRDADAKTTAGCIPEHVELKGHADISASQPGEKSDNAHEQPQLEHGMGDLAPQCTREEADELSAFASLFAVEGHTCVKRLFRMEVLLWEYEASQGHLHETFLEMGESGQVACAESLERLCQRPAATESSWHEIGIEMEELNTDQGAGGLEAWIGSADTTEGSVEAGG